MMTIREAVLSRNAFYEISFSPVRYTLKQRGMIEAIKGFREAAGDTVLQHFIQQMRGQFYKLVDGVASELRRSEQQEFNKMPRRAKRAPLLSPEEDVKKLIISAGSLDEVWQFLNKRLRSGSEPGFMLFSAVDEVSELLRLRFLFPQREDKPFQGEFIPLCDKNNHLVKTVLRADTTFSSRLDELGRELYPYLESPTLSGPQVSHVFSIPLVAAGKTIAVITLGFDELDSFSQAKLSYIYMLRDQLAQVVWNLILQERIQNQPQLDNLTGLITFSSMQQILTQDLRRAKIEGQPLSLVLIDINNLKGYNERYTHQMGDRAIARLASVIKHHVRGVDTVARFGNDEIAIVLPETAAEEAKALAERFVSALAQPHSAVKPFAISVGIATYPADTLGQDGLMQLAENTLHFAKLHSESQMGSVIMLARNLQEADDQERVEVFAAQVARKYGETGSDLFETLMRRIEKDAQLEADNLMLETVASLAGAMDAKDKYTRGHSQSVANYAVALSSAMDLPPAEVEKVRLAAFFHDIGKIGVPETILNKPGPLTPAEKEIMDQHPVIGARQILQPVSALKDIVPLVEFHHERWDGTGHPMGLKGENIPVGARIVSVVDAFHALTSNRPYREALPLEEAMTILQDGSGTIWDPVLIDAFASMVRKARCQDATRGLDETAEYAEPVLSRAG